MTNPKLRLPNWCVRSRPSASRLLVAFVCCAAFGLALAPRVTTQVTPIVIEGARLIIAPKTAIDGTSARVAIRDGKVTAAGNQIPADLLGRAKRIRFEGATILPGMVIAHDYLELVADVAETISAFTPSLIAADAFDPFDDALERHARGGVTSVGLAPSSRNIVGGLASAVQWQTDGIGTVIEPASYLKAALVREALDQNRYPTSRMGAADLLRSQFALLQDPLRSGEPTLANVMSGSRRLAIHAETVAEITEALALCAEFDLQPILIGAAEAGKCIDELREAGASLALRQLDFASKTSLLETPAALEQAGLSFSFLGSRPEQLRTSAALAMRYGVSPQTAIAALTRVPATQLGIDRRTGTLRNGRQADIVVFDGDPLDLTSTITAVFLAGQRVPPQVEQSIR